jgi:hypothetical protein
VRPVFDSCECLIEKVADTNRIDLFQRVPSDLRRYLAYTWDLKKRYGSIMNFVLQERLRWKDLTPHDPTPFEDRGRILSSAGQSRNLTTIFR